MNSCDRCLNFVVVVVSGCIVYELFFCWWVNFFSVNSWNIFVRIEGLFIEESKKFENVVFDIGCSINF